MSIANSSTNLQFQFQYQFADLPAESESESPSGANKFKFADDAALDGLGAVRFAYTDSGPPTRSDIESNKGYRTLVCVPGHSYTAHIFARVLALAPVQGIRVIALNRRDFAPSTLLSDRELADARAQAPEDEDENRRVRYLRARGAEIARFLEFVSKDVVKGEGEIALLGWSLGTIFTISCLAWLTSSTLTPPAVTAASATLQCRARVEAALRGRLSTLFIHDSAYNVLGYAPVVGAYHPLSDPVLAALPPDERAEAFESWLTAYFEHPFHTGGREQIKAPVPGTDAEKLAALMLRVDGPIQVQHTPLANGDEERRAYKATIDLAPASRSESVFYGPEGFLPATLLAGTYTAFGICSEAGEEDGEFPLPDLKIVYLHGTHSLPTIQLGAWTLVADKNLEKAKRRVEAVPLLGGNHYVHWDNPSRFLQVIQDNF